MKRLATVLLPAALVFAALLSAIPGEAQQCVSQFQSNARQYYDLLGQCAKRHRLMDSDPSLVMLYETIQQTGPDQWETIYSHTRGRADPNFTWKSRPDYTVRLPDEPDGRWKSTGNSISFNCSLPINNQNQAESFLECARTYACALQAGTCAVVEAKRSGSSDCNAIANRCLQQHPVPGMASLGTSPSGQAALAPGAGPGTSVPSPLQQQPGDPRQQAFLKMSAQCQADFAAFLSASEAKDGAGATAAYGRLRSAQCDQAMKNLASQSGLALPERTLSPRASGALANAFNRDPNAVTGNIGQPTEGVAQGGGFDWAPVLDLGIALFGMGAQIAGGWGGPSYHYSGGRGTDYSSLNPRARSTYGQGAPRNPGPPTSQSTITGTR